MSESTPITSYHPFSPIYTYLEILPTRLGTVRCLFHRDTFVPLLTKIHREDCYQSVSPATDTLGKVGFHPHFTLFSGFLDMVDARMVRSLYKGIQLPTLFLDGISILDSVHNDYLILQANVVLTPELQYYHTLAEFLPHINPYSEFRHAITVAYIKREAKESVLQAIQEFTGMYYKQMKVEITDILFLPAGEKAGVSII